MTNILDIYSPSQLIDGILAIQAVLAFCYTFSSFFVASNTYSGFNSVFLGIVYIAMIGATYHGIRKSINRTNYGAVLAASVFLVFMSLQSSIYWGQYSTCVLISKRYNTITVTKFDAQCYHTSAMKSVCTFSVFIFLAYIAQVFLLLKFKDDLLGNGPLNEGYAPVMKEDTMHRVSIPPTIPTNSAIVPPLVSSGHHYPVSTDL